MPEDFTFPWYVWIAIGIPLLGLAGGLGKLKQKIDTLITHDEESSGTHSVLYNKVNKIERNLYHLMGQMKVKPID